jgi:transcription-repair coupling factor (superfamily II helicase)
VKNIARAATAIAEYLDDKGSVAFLCDDEQHGEALAAALAAIAPGHEIVALPSSDALPGDSAPASPANIGLRVAALRKLRAIQTRNDGVRFACILSGEASARRYPSPEAFDGAPPTLRVGDAIELDIFAATLETLGYWPDERVDEPGEVAVRGEVVDLFPADLGQPVRVEIVDGRIGSLRSYDPATQRTIEDLDHVEIGRAAEPDLTDAVSILSHLGDAAIAVSEKALKRRARFVSLAEDAARRKNAALDAIDEAAWSKAMAGRQRLEIDAPPEDMPRFVERRSPAAAFAAFVKPLRAAGARIVIAGSTRDLRFLRGRLERRLGVSAQDAGSWREALSFDPGSVAFLRMPIRAGYVGKQGVLVAAGDLLGSRALLEDGPNGASPPLLTAAADIRIGDVIIHEDHGVGCVSGLEPMPGEPDSEAIILEYAGGARRMVPVGGADRIWRYGADIDAVTLDTLDGASWSKRRSRIDAAIAESARGLAALAIERARRVAIVLDPDPSAYERFVSGFPFNETADQTRAITAVRDDLAAGVPMDRLVVGDVGYGKTEVALRAAALAALAGCQVAVAAPTTVLVRQHLETFARRFEALGLVVAGLSRLTSATERKRVKAGLADGSIDIVVGTGAIRGKGVDYARLGLVVIDEEQRFGAADKIRLRGNGETHLLALSATPIPRTLQMALVGLQQISIIATPPARRQPIRTSLDTLDDGRLRTALQREKGRGGQSFVVVPRIEDMAGLGERLRRIVPELAIIEAHGKMPAAEIDAAMVGFADGDGDILLATNIVEAGLDVPRANTMIVWRADRFGLAQLHQLRGRVGRGNRRGQVILLTEGDGAIGERTLKRLRTLAAFDRLGAGFDISAQDLDMRGAGDLLGEAQAGHVRLIGIDLYQALLESALREARGEAVPRWTSDLRLGVPGSFPENWIPEADTRLSLYVRLARLDTIDGVEAFEEELVDRFGALLPLAETLIGAARVRILARMAGIARIDAGPAAIALTPVGAFGGDAAGAGLIEKDGRWLLTGPVDTAMRVERIQHILEDLAA